MTAHPTSTEKTFFTHLIDGNSQDLKRVVARVEVILSDATTVYFSINGDEKRWAHRSIREHWYDSEEEAFASEPYLEAL
jgi:hypothetical protein